MCDYFVAAVVNLPLILFPFHKLSNYSIRHFPQLLYLGPRYCHINKILMKYIKYGCIYEKVRELRELRDNYMKALMRLDAHKQIIFIELMVKEKKTSGTV